MNGFIGEISVVASKNMFLMVDMESSAILTMSESFYEDYLSPTDISLATASQIQFKNMIPIFPLILLKKQLTEELTFYTTTLAFLP